MTTTLTAIASQQEIKFLIENDLIVDGMEELASPAVIVKDACGEATYIKMSGDEGDIIAMIHSQNSPDAWCAEDVPELMALFDER